MLGQILGTIIGDKAGRMIGANMDSASASTSPTLSQVLVGNQQSGQTLQMPQMQQTQKETPSLSKPVETIAKVLAFI